MNEDEREEAELKRKERRNKVIPCFISLNILCFDY